MKQKIVAFFLMAISCFSQSSKQIFIAFDKQIAYKPRTQKILQEHTVLKLSDSNCELYGESWNKENDK